MTEIRGETVVLRPLEASDAATLRAIREHPEVHAWWGRLEDDFPQADEPTSFRFAILLDGEVVGMARSARSPSRTTATPRSTSSSTRACAAAGSGRRPSGRSPTTWLRNAAITGS